MLLRRRALEVRRAVAVRSLERVADRPRGGQCSQRSRMSQNATNDDWTTTTEVPE
jgi:hypothetical protein